VKTALVSFACGVLFALGLGISGMTEPGKVTAFLDFFGHWDPSLLYVMAGAIAVYAVGYRLVLRRSQPLLADGFHLPKLRRVDRSLVLGALLFGVGWGLAGFCPGPALTSLATLRFQTLLFVFSMLSGMAIYQWSSRRGTPA
jgi:uncharacterized membrane protein YedE/YeeE